MTTSKEKANRAAWGFSVSVFTRGAWPNAAHSRDIAPTMKRAAEILEAKECFADRFGEEGSLEVEFAGSLACCFGLSNAADDLVESAFRHAIELDKAGLLSQEQAKRSRALELVREQDAERKRLEREAADMEREAADRRSAELEKERKLLERKREELNA